MDQIPLHSRYRGEGILCGTPEEVWDCIKPVASGLREKWDDNVSSFEIVQSITDAATPRPHLSEEGSITSVGKRSAMQTSPALSLAGNNVSLRD